MALSISGRSVPSNRPNVGQSRINLVTRPQVGNDLQAVVSSNATSQRVMQQISAPFWDYAFTIPPGQVNHEGYGVVLNEIARPYLTPMIDVTGGKALRASFEFPIIPTMVANASLLDGFARGVDAEISVLQEFANFGIPVTFDNMHPALTTPTWYIDNLNFNHSRIGETGETSQATCTISLIEFVARTNKFILLPRFQYGKLPPIIKTPGVPGNTNKDDVEGNLKLAAGLEALRRAAVAQSQSKSGLDNSLTKIYKS